MADRFDARTILPVALAALALITHFGHYTNAGAFDFYQFWIFGQAARDIAPANLYDDAERSRIGVTFHERAMRDSATSQRHRDVAEKRRQPQAVSTPLLYTLFGLIATGHFEGDLFNYLLLTAVAVTAALLLLGRAFGYAWTTSCLWMCALLMWFGPFFSDIEVGNVNRLQLLIVAVYLWLQTRENQWGRDLIGGVLLSLMITFKPNLAIVPAMLIVAWAIVGDFERLLRQLAGLAAGIAAAAALSAWYFGSAACWSHWFAAVRETTQNMQLHAAQNVSFAWWLTQQLDVNAWLPLTAALTLAVWIAVAVGRRARDAQTRNALIVAAAIGIALLGSPLTWHHYLVLATPLWLVMLMPQARFAGLMRPIGVLVLLAFGFARLSRDFVGVERSYEMLVPLWWLSIALPLVAIIVALARPGQQAD